MTSERIRKMGLSPTLRVNAVAMELAAAGHDVLDFSAGQPDFPTPLAVKHAGKAAIDADRTRYTVNQGIIELRNAVVETLKRDRGLDYTAEQILVSPGAKASLYFACMTLFDPGDEVLVPSPYWVSYPEQLRLAGATPVPVICSEALGFKLDSDTLKQAIGPRTRGIVLNYPCNPTGACYSREELEPLAEILVGAGLWIVADEIYSRLLFDDRRFTSVAALGPEVQARTVLIDGMSKTYSMTGWRIGYAAAPTEIIKGMSKLQSHCTSNATSISQWASVEALGIGAAELADRVHEFQRRRDRVLQHLRALDGVSCVCPEGAFYAFPNVSGLFGSGRGVESGQELAEYLLRSARVATVPGEAFGSPDHLRLSFAVSLDQIDEGMERIAQALRVAAPGS